MCRHLAYVGPPVPLGALLFDAPHSLIEQAAHPRHQAAGRVNADGWGVGWFADDATRGHHRTVKPIWQDNGFDACAITARAFVAAARLASPGAQLHPSGNAPFVADGWLFSLNGYVDGFRQGVEDELRAGVGEARLAAIEGDTDSEVVFAMVLDRLDRGDAPHAALGRTVADIASRASAKLNLLLADRDASYGTRVGNSLFARPTTIVSEPLDDDPAWIEVPDHSLVSVRRGAGVEVVPL